jgi:prepilin-type N-terminal cleavage/methylation domain-containing protein
MAAHRGHAGFSLIELLTALVLLGVLASLAAPAMSTQLRRARVRSALDLLTADVYRARVLAVREAGRFELAFRPAAGCARAYVLVRVADGMVLDSVDLQAPGGVCLSSNAAQAMVIDSRGMLVGSPRKIYGRAGGEVDSVTVSMAGRLYRWY